MSAERLLLLKALHDCGCLVAQPRAGKSFAMVNADQCCCVSCDLCSAFNAIVGKKPDFIVLCAADNSGLTWMVLEMKSRLQGVSDIVAQLQAGARAIESDARFQVKPRGRAREVLMPVVVHSGGVHSANFERLLKKRVSFRGRPYPVRVKGSGVQLGFGPQQGRVL